YANSAAEARDMELGWPAGDSGRALGSPGGFYADSSYGYSLEARAGCPDDCHPIIREKTYGASGRAYDFLYANNNALHPDSAHLNGAPKGGYQYGLAEGW